MLAITAIGKVAADRLIRRGAGRAGDRLVVSGPHGLSGLGLQLLQNPNDPATSHLSESLKQAAIKAHQQPIPRFDAVAALQQSQPAACPGGWQAPIAAMAYAAAWNCWATPAATNQCWI